METDFILWVNSLFGFFPQSRLINGDRKAYAVSGSIIVMAVGSLAT